MKLSYKIIICLLLNSFSLSQTFAAAPSPSEGTTAGKYSLLTQLPKLQPLKPLILLEGGGFSASQGSVQNIGIEGLIGDHFTLAHPQAQNGLLGLGLYWQGREYPRYDVFYGINAFFFAHTIVSGYVVQEDTFVNLFYRYSLYNYPIYLAAKAIKHSDNYSLTFDFGVGANIINTAHFYEYPLMGSDAIPDTYILAGQQSLAPSAMIGIGIKFKSIYGYSLFNESLPLEIGYRFFYLGRGKLNKINSELMNTLNTGTNYANAIILTISC